MDIQWVYMLLFAMLFLCFLLLMEVAHLSYKIDSEDTRIIIVLSAGLQCLLYPLIFDNYVILFTFFMFFIIFTTLAEYVGVLKSIHNIERNTWGHIIYPIVPLIALYFSKFTGNLYDYYLIVIPASISDPLATIVGRRWPYKEYKIQGVKKSFMGSLTLFLVTIISTFIIYALFRNVIDITNVVIYIIFYSIFMTVVEFVSLRGMDVLSLPLVSMVLLYLLHNNLL